MDNTNANEKLTLNTELPRFGEENYPGTAYEIVKKARCGEQLNRIEKAALLQHIYFKMKSMSYRCPKYMKRGAEDAFEGINVLIESL